jgi:uncharacterized protein
MHEMFTKPGAISWTELSTTDVEAAKKFYGALFGWTFQEFPMPDTVYHVVKTGEREIGGIMKTPKEAAGMPPFWMTYVTVENVDQTVKNAKETGGKALLEPMDIPQVGRLAVLQDPQGAVFAVISYLKK